MSWDWDDVTELLKTDGKISAWKVLAGAAAGVVTVVALPIAGPIGAITATGAMVASGVGAAVGAGVSLLDDPEKEAERKGRERGEAEATARYAESFEKLKAALRDEINKRRSAERHYDLIVALYAVAMSCAACDGEVSEEERKDIEEFIGGIAIQRLPNHVRAKLDEITRSPPDVATAFKLVKKYDLACMDMFDDVIELVIHADRKVMPQEERFRARWAQLKAAA